MNKEGRCLEARGGIGELWLGKMRGAWSMLLLLWGCEYGCMLGRVLRREEIWCVSA